MITLEASPGLGSVRVEYYLEAGSDLGAAIISSGLGVTWHKGKCDRAAAYDALEATARQGGVGLWAPRGGP